MEPIKSELSLDTIQPYELICGQDMADRNIEKQKHVKGKRRLKITAFAALSAIGAAGLVYVALFLKRRFKKAKEDARDGTYEAWESYKTPEGISIAYERQGSGDCPVVFFHGMYAGADRGEWQYIAKELAKTDAGYQIYTVDMPGFGQSEHIKRPWAAYRYVNALHAFLRDVVQKASTVVAVGISADIALMLSLLHPEDMQKLVLIAPEGIGKGFATKEDVRNLKFLLWPIIGTLAFICGTTPKRIRAMLEEMFYEKERIPEDFLQRVMKNARRAKGAKVCYAQCKTRFAACSTVHAFQKLSCPFLLIWGEKNEKNPSIYLEEAERMQEKGEFMLFEHTAELPHLENPKGFLQVLQDFL